MEGIKKKGRYQMKMIVLLGRIFFASIFLMSGLHHFSSQTIGYAASHGLSNAEILVPLSGVLALLGGLSVLFGYKAKIGAWMLVLFLVPVTLVMHNFWSITDPSMAQMQMTQFMKNLAMLGGALVICYFGAGPVSLDAVLAHKHAVDEELKQKMAA
jgi:putative oxidoreductase